MKRFMFIMAVAAMITLAASDEMQAQRGGRGGGAARGGSFGTASRSVSGPAGGAGYGSRSGGTVVGPAGGSRSAGTGSGSYTTQRGTTIQAAGAGRTATGPGGTTAGRGVGAVQVTTPGGKTATKVGTAGGIAGPGGNAVGTRSGVGVASGPNGAMASKYHGGVAVGPGGAVAGGTRGTVASGPYGAAASRTTVATGGRGTYYASRTTLATTGGAVRTNFGYYNAFRPGWYAQYPGAWFAAGWTAARIWSVPAWGTVSTYCGYSEEPVYWDYGENVVYNGDNISISGTEVPAADFAQQATDLAQTGKDAMVEAKGDDFQPLGVFAMISDGETKSTNIFQLAVNKDGILRGNYYNATTDTTETVYGSVNKDTQRAAWTVADRKTPVYECGIANMTKAETTMLVHYSKEKSQQFTLVRIEQPEDGAGDEKK
jgi:hypothetical protein